MTITIVIATAFAFAFFLAFAFAIAITTDICIVSTITISTTIATAVTVNQVRLYLFFRWVLNWTPCSKTCGQGKQVQIFQCLEQVTQTQVRETNTCTGAKPAQPSIPSRLCNYYPCPAKWSVGNWSEVSCLQLVSFILSK